MATSKPDGSKKYFDVAKPGKSMPSSSSRPTIIKNRTVMSEQVIGAEVNAGSITVKSADDDMPVSTTAPRIEPLSSSAKAKSKPAAKPKKIVEEDVVKPMPGVDELAADDDESPVLTVADDKPAATDEPAAETTTEPAEAAPASEAPVESVPAPEEPLITTTDSIGADSDLSSMGMKTSAEKEAEKSQKAAEAKLQAIDKLVEDKTYFVSIGVRKQRQSGKHRFLTFIIILLLLALLANLAIDSGMIETTIEPPLRLFKTPE